MYYKLLMQHILSSLGVHTCIQNGIYSLWQAMSGYHLHVFTKTSLAPSSTIIYDMYL